MAGLLSKMDGTCPGGGTSVWGLLWLVFILTILIVLVTLVLTEVWLGCSA